jgi:hypothetical protein
MAWSILRPVQRSLPKELLLGISSIIVTAAVLWPLSGIKETFGYPWQLLIAFLPRRPFAILRIQFSFVLACCSQLLRIGWRDHELQIATGLGLYSLVSLAGTIRPPDFHVVADDA